MSIKVGNEEFTEFSDLYNDPDFMNDSEEIEFEVALIGKLLDPLGYTQAIVPKKKRVAK